MSECELCECVWVCVCVCVRSVCESVCGLCVFV